MKKVLCFGNEMMESDSIVKRIAGMLNIEGVRFIKCDSPADVLAIDNDTYIMDVAKGISRVTVFDDVDRIKHRKIFSMHDLDLGFFLKLSKKMGRTGKVKIIGVPEKGDVDDIIRQVKMVLQDG